MADTNIFHIDALIDNIIPKLKGTIHQFLTSQPSVVCPLTIFSAIFVLHILAI
jgi:hypothetical protein